MKTKKVFINCSNHPSSKWSEAQLTAAKAYGEIVDIPFPNVAPELSRYEVVNLAIKLTAQIKSTAFPADIAAVHIMGEMVLTHLVLRFLYMSAITCVASTTRRIVKELPDGSKVSQFEFVQFREY